VLFLKNHCMSKSYEKLLGYSFFLIAKKRYTVTQLKKKLVDRKVVDKDIEEGEKGDENIEKVIQRLLELKYLDDDLFVKEWVRQRRSLRPRGMFMLRNELKMKGIEESLIDRYVNEDKIDEVVDAQAIINKKRRSLDRTPINKRKEKTFNLLRNKGFSIQTIYKVLDSW